MIGPWTRHEHPTDRRKPIAAIRYSIGALHVRADADSVRVDGDLPRSMNAAAATHLATVLRACAVAHARLAARKPIPRSTP